MLGETKNWASRQKAPATIGLIASFIVSTLTFWLLRGEHMTVLALTGNAMSRPWTFFTYPWFYLPLNDGLTLMFFIFLLLWIFMLGRDLESDLGSGRFLAMWFALTFLGGLFMWIGFQVAHVGGGLGAPYLPEAAMTIVWCARRPTQQVMLYGILPVAGKWLAALTAITMVLLYGAGAPILGIMAILNEAVAGLWALDRLPFLPYETTRAVRVRKEKEAPAARGGRVYDEKYYEEVRRREQERVERDRLRRLLGESEDEK